MIGILWLCFWQLTGYYLSRRVFYSLSRPQRLLLGSVCGSMLAIWLPIPFSFVFGFSLLSHSAALLLGLLLLVLVRFCFPPRLETSQDLSLFPASFLCLALPLLILCCYLLITHTLRTERGAYYTGQCSYGDMAMHLGFITSLAVQGEFPPAYSILPGERLCYPFLCDSVSSSLLLLGTPLRWAYMLPAFLALAQVFCGFFLLAQAVCLRRQAPLLAFVFFFFNGGLGLVYFFSDYSFYELFTGFYKTPTNLTDKGIRWVNVIVDMLLPQRATLFGWAALFAVFLLLYLAVFKDQEALFLPAGLLGGLLPMIHTHSYLALGLVAACWLAASAVREGISKRWLFCWLRFGLPAILLAIPQLLLWTFHSVGGNEQFLRFHIDWVNEGKENWLWFWLKNVGPLFLLSPLAYIRSGKAGRDFALPAVLLFLLCEIVVFQPNVYDNNKLLYVSYALFCILTADWLLGVLKKLRHPLLRVSLLALLLALCMNASLFSLGRELISGLPGHSYRLFSQGDVAAAAYIRENTEPDALFLTASNHNNAVSALTGRNIYCGCPSYLFYHGLDYESRLETEKRLLTDPSFFEEQHAQLGIEYVYLGDYERAIPGCAEAYFQSRYPLVFSSGKVNIYQIK